MGMLDNDSFYRIKNHNVLKLNLVRYKKLNYNDHLKN